MTPYGMVGGIFVWSVKATQTGTSSNILIFQQLNEEITEWGMRMIAQWDSVPTLATTTAKASSTPSPSTTTTGRLAGRF